MKHISEAMKEAGLPVHRTSPLRSQPHVQAFLVRLLLDGDQITATDAAAKLSCSVDHTRSAFVALHDSTLVRIVRWQRLSQAGPWFAVYAWCGTQFREDEPYPRKSASSKEVCHG